MLHMLRNVQVMLSHLWDTAVHILLVFSKGLSLPGSKVEGILQRDEAYTNSRPVADDSHTSPGALKPLQSG